MASIVPYVESVVALLRHKTTASVFEQAHETPFLYVGSVVALLWHKTTASIFEQAHETP